MWTWLNNNSGALTVIVTIVYVIATILICRYNAKSAESANKQVEESCRQQKQSAGIQLYSLRKQAMELVQQEKYNDVYWDIPVLFDGDINTQFISLTNYVNKLSRLHNYIAYFGQHLKENFGEDVCAQFRNLIVSLELSGSGDMTEETLYSFCDQYTFTKYCEDEGETITYNYRELNQSAVELNRIIQGKRVALFLKMQEFVRESIA